MEQPENTMGTRETGRGSVLLKKLESCQPCVTFTQMDTLLPDSCHHFQQDNESKLFEDHSEAEASTDISPVDHFLGCAERTSPIHEEPYHPATSGLT